MSVAYGVGDKGKATKLHSLIVRSRGSCERCGDADYSKLQCAHIIRRTYAWTRTDERGAWALCARCHFHLDNHPDEFMHFVRETIGMAQFDRLKRRALDGVNKKFDWPAEVARLAAIWKEMEQAA